MKIVGFEKRVCMEKKVILFFAASIFQLLLVFAQQQPTITLKVKNKPLYEVLEEIRTQARLDLVGDLNLLKGSKPVTINVKNRDIDEVLTIISEGQPVKFNLLRNTIITKPNNSENSFVDPTSFTKDSPIAIKTFILKGIVRDQFGNSLSGASIRVINGRKNATSSSTNGSYEILTDGNGALLISMLGYKQERIEVQGRKRIDVILHSQESVIDEVLVNIGYTKRNKPSMTGASTVISKKDIENFNQQNVFSIIQSLDRSLFLEYDLFSGSNPNIIPEVYMRGVNNIGGYVINSPLIILDGLEVTLERLYDIDVTRIESISLLKDVSSTVLYGSRGGGGVLIVETDKPQAGKLLLTYNTSASVAIPNFRDYNLMNAAQKLSYEESAGLYDASNFYSDPLLISIKQEELDNQYAQKKRNVLMGVDTDWLSQPVATTVSLNNSLRIEGGSDRFQFGIDGHYGDLKGVMKNSGRERKGIGFQINYRMADRLYLANHSYLQNIKSYHSPYGSFATYAQMNPYQRIYDNNGELIEHYSDETVAAVAYNPLTNLKLPFKNQSNSKLLSNRFALRWDINKTFKLKTDFIIEKGLLNEERYISSKHSSFAEINQDSIGEYFTNKGKNLRYSATVNLEYAKEIVEHKWRTNLIAEANSNNYNQSGMLRNGFEDRASIDAAWIDSISTNKEPVTYNHFNRLASLLLMGNYLYKKKYVIDLAYRMDGASNFGRNNRFSHFWSVGTGYNLHEEDFMQGLDIQEWSLFLNKGVSGMQAFTTNMNSSSYQLNQGDGYFKEESYQFFYQGNPDLRWPKIHSWSIGTSAKLAKKRLRFSFNYYNKVTDRMVSWITVAPSLGIPNNSYFENMGQLRNRGFEAGASVALLDNKVHNLYWDIGITTIKNSGKLIRVSEELTGLNENNMITNLKGYYVQNSYFQQGESVRNIKGVVSLGIDPASGKEIFLTKSGNITDNWNPADIQVIGNKEPNLFGNISSSFTYKSFHLQAYFSYTLGGDIYNYTLVDRIENNYGYMNTHVLANQERWRKPGDVVAFKDIRTREKTFLSSRFVQRENTLRFSMLLLNYDLPNAWISKYNLRRLKINFSMSDILRLSNVKMERGVDYPFASRFNFGFITQF